MSMVGFRTTSGEVASGTSAKTILQIRAASNHAVRVDKVSVSCKGVTSDAAPVLVELLRQTTDGTMTSGTVVKDPDDAAETLQTAAAHTATAEPTAGAVLESELVHPQGGGFVWHLLADGRPIKVGGGDRLGVRVTAAADVNVVASASGDE